MSKIGADIAVECWVFKFFSLFEIWPFTLLHGFCMI